MFPDQKIAIIGAGLAGSESAWQLAERGHAVSLFEMRPARMTPAHKTGMCAELVCSNSFKSRSIENAHGLLKSEMAILKSMILQTGEKFSVPAGQALAIDRERFASRVSEKLKKHPLINFCNKEITNVHEIINSYSFVIIATGPLTSDAFSLSLQDILGEKYLSFYDAISPVVTEESIDMNVAFRASRYGKGDDDYINCPMDFQQYQKFIAGVKDSEKANFHDFEDLRPFEGCLPIETMIQRGTDTLRFGPMKPVGLEHPRTGDRFHAIVQLRQENIVGSLYNMVGFQTKMKWSAQKKVFKMIPGLEKAEFVRLGSVHRNTFLNSPVLLNSQLSLKSNPKVFFAGQITGVEGYMESTAMGIIASRQISSKIENRKITIPPPETMIGALLNYITNSDPKTFQPMNANFGLFIPPRQKMGKAERKKWYAERALSRITDYSNDF